MKYAALPAVFLFLFLGISGGSLAAECPGADTPVSDTVAAAASTHCLVNEERSRAGIPEIVHHAQLQASAQAYSRRMVAEQFFSHVPADGATFSDRLKLSGYADSGFIAGGENLGWRGGNPTPRHMVDAWMASPGHRANLMNPHLRHSGVGVAAGTPAGVAGATFVHHLGARDDSSPGSAPAGSVQGEKAKKGRKGTKAKKGKKSRPGSGSRRSVAR